MDAFGSESVFAHGNFDISLSGQASLPGKGSPFRSFFIIFEPRSNKIVLIISNAK